ncbi:hypothetical protein QTO34_017252 [Cnephaeus nilssonii]|uniref:Uncharacterized protein n=1 Tax=Cnephaeus nilssonii TaxID=3371016 RepID=A0AA40I1L4_CNENI|nr:hypothetical protein QTO34_017252 [Eptesicus nilssonii]
MPKCHGSSSEEHEVASVELVICHGFNNPYHAWRRCPMVRSQLAHLVKTQDEETEMQRSKLGTLVLYFEFKVVGTHVIAGVLKLRPAGHMQPAEDIYPARRRHGATGVVQNACVIAMPRLHLLMAPSDGAGHQQQVQVGRVLALVVNSSSGARSGTIDQGWPPPPPGSLMPGSPVVAPSPTATAGRCLQGDRRAIGPPFTPAFTWHCPLTCFTTLPWSRSRWGPSGLAVPPLLPAVSAPSLTPAMFSAAPWWSVHMAVPTRWWHRVSSAPLGRQVHGKASLIPKWAWPLHAPASGVPQAAQGWPKVQASLGWWLPSHSGLPKAQTPSPYRGLGQAAVGANPRHLDP